MRAVDVVDPGGQRHSLVLRSYRPGSPWTGDAPDLVDHERAALERLAAAGVTGVPLVLATDRDGHHAGFPALLSTRLPGRPRLCPMSGQTQHEWAERMADGVTALLDQLRAVPTNDLDPFQPWPPAATADATTPPAWFRDSALWSEAMSAVAGPLPASAAPPQAIHRDCNPGNLLWVRGRITGVVDWVHLCRGAVEDDVARCRINIGLVAGPSAADRFLARIRAHGLPYEPVWDLAVLAELLPFVDEVLAANRLGAAVTLAQLHERAEAMVAAARG